MKAWTFGLRTRFLAAGVLLVLTTVAATAWTLLVLSRLATVAAMTVRDTDEAAATTAGISSALEREDDALLVILGGVAGGRASLGEARTITDLALSRLQRSTLDGLKSTALDVENSVGKYRRAVDVLVADGGSHPLERYHSEANPLLRRAVSHTATARTQRFKAAIAATVWARDEVRRARGIVGIIAIAAVAVAAVVALRLARHVILPMHQLANAAEMIREGKFETTVDVRAADEIGRVAEAFNNMARRLAEFHRSKLGEILRAKRELEATMRALPDAVALIDAGGQVVSTNPEAEHLFKSVIGAAPLKAEDLVSVLGPTSASFREALLSQKPLDRVALESAVRVVLDGELCQFIPRIVPLAPADDQEGVVLVLSDVTQLARLDEMRMEVIAVASHELRTPVTTLRMALLMLAEMSENLEARPRELVRTALGGVDLLSETVDELLDMTRIEAGRLRLNSEAVDIADLVNEVADRARTRATELGLSLDVHAPMAPLSIVVGDRARLRIVVDNIINNSLKYTPRCGAIAVEITSFTKDAASPPAISVAITDSGSGIPREFQSRVFEKFFRVEHHRSSSEEGPRGSGIGLYLCKEIIELHGGRIHCEARSGGPGTRIVFVLPAKQPSWA